MLRVCDVILPPQVADAPCLQALCCERGLWHAGGSHAVAAALGWRTQRRRRHSSEGLQAAAELVADYLAGLPAGEQERMPVHRKLLARGRHDIRYALQVMRSSSTAHSSMITCSVEHTIYCVAPLALHAYGCCILRLIVYAASAGFGKAVQSVVQIMSGCMREARTAFSVGNLGMRQWVDEWLSLCIAI